MINVCCYLVVTSLPYTKASFPNLFISTDFSHINISWAHAHLSIPTVVILVRAFGKVFFTSSPLTYPLIYYQTFLKMALINSPLLKSLLYFFTTYEKNQKSWHVAFKISDNLSPIYLLSLIHLCVYLIIQQWNESALTKVLSISLECKHRKHIHPVYFIH